MKFLTGVTVGVFVGFVAIKMGFDGSVLTAAYAKKFITDQPQVVETAPNKTAPEKEDKPAAIAAVEQSSVVEQDLTAQEIMQPEPASNTTIETGAFAAEQTWSAGEAPGGDEVDAAVAQSPMMQRLRQDIMTPAPRADDLIATKTASELTGVTSISSSRPLPSGQSSQPMSGFQAAWTPFRSETSARGFAGRLSQQLNREFRVVKRAPGRYEVGFDYDTEMERAALLDAITSL